jgi:hypothetical protein
MGQASSREGYEAVPDVESVPLSAANLEAMDQRLHVVRAGLHRANTPNAACAVEDAAGAAVH